MEIEMKYEIPMFSACLEHGPKIEFEGLNIKLTLRGYDENDMLCEKP